MRPITIIQQRVPKCMYMAGTSNLTWDNCQFLSFFSLKLPQCPSDSEPNTVACSKFEFPFDCQKNTRTAMRLMYRVHFGPDRFSLHSYLGLFSLHVGHYH